MPTYSKIRFMPTKIKYKFLVSFCLMSVVPTLVGIYIGSLFIKYPFVADTYSLFTISVIVLFSMMLSLLGYEVTKEMVTPITDLAAAAQNIAAGELDKGVELKGAEELEDLSKSLRVISRNARELLEKVDKLSQKEKITGLYNLTYMRERLQEEIQRAILYQQPCSFVYLVINGFDGYALSCGQKSADDVSKEMAAILNKHLSALDRAGCIGQGEFALILPDKNKKKAIEIAQHVHHQVSQAPFVKEKAKGAGSIDVSLGISENPIDGVDAQGLIQKARDRARARSPL